MAMRPVKRESHYWLGSAGAVLAAFCLFFAFASNLRGQRPAQGQDTQAQGRGGRGGQGPAPAIPKEYFDPGLNRRLLPPGGPTPRTADGHPDLSGRYYPNTAGKMVQVAYPVNKAAYEQFDPDVTPEEKPSYKPGVDPKYTRPNPYG